MQALNAALALQQKTPSIRLPLVLCMNQETGLASLFEERTANGDDGDTIRVFRVFDRTCTPYLVFNGTYELLAQAIHEEYIRNERGKGYTAETNPSLVPWEQLPEVLKESNRHQAEYTRIKLDAIGCGITVTREWDVEPFSFTPEEIEIMAKIEHDRFIRERKRQGYRYGAEKSAELKTSPTLVPWDELSEEEKEKDRDVARHIPELLARARFRIYRLNTGNC